MILIELGVLHTVGLQIHGVRLLDLTPTPNRICFYSLELSDPWIPVFRTPASSFIALLNNNTRCKDPITDVNYYQQFKQYDIWPNPLTLMNFFTLIYFLSYIYSLKLCSQIVSKIRGKLFYLQSFSIIVDDLFYSPKILLYCVQISFQKLRFSFKQYENRTLTYLVILLNKFTSVPNKSVSILVQNTVFYGN